MDNVTLGIVCTVIGTVLGIIGAINYAKKDTKEETQCTTRLETKIDYTARGIDDIKLDNKEQSRRIISINDRLIVVEESAKSAHKRIDKLEGDVKNGLDNK